MLQEFHLIVLSLIVVFSSSRTLRTKQHQLIHWEISLSKDTQEFLTYCTACTNNCYFHNRFFLKLFKVNLLEKKRMLLSSMMISHLWLSSNAYPLKSAAKVRLFLQYQAKNPINYCFLLHFYYFC